MSKKPLNDNDLFAIVMGAIIGFALTVSTAVTFGIFP